MVTATALELPIRVCDSGTPEWYQARLTGIGASEAAAAAGLSEYDTPLELYHRKRGNLPETRDDDAMRLGRLLEPIVASEFQHKTGLKVNAFDQPGLCRHPVDEFVLATPDYLLLTEPIELLETKATMWYMAENLGEQNSDEVPKDWLCQAQQQMYVMGLAVCHIAALIDGRTLKTFRVERNDDLIDGLVSAERELWERIQNEDPPEADWEHESTPRLIKEIYGTVNGDVIELPMEAAEAWIAAEAIRESITQSEANWETLRARVRVAIGENSAGVLPGTDRMIRRKLIQRAGYTVDATEYVDMRAVNVPKAKSK